MKICKKNHFKVTDGKISFESEVDEKIVALWKRIIEDAVRLDIYEKICNLQLTENRAQIVKNGIENTALTVQDICAQIALGKETK